MDKVIYRCKACGWEKTLPATWADVKPRFCPNNKCEYSKKKSKGKKSFRGSPEQLQVILLEKKVKAEPEKPKKGRKKKVKETDERSSEELQGQSSDSPTGDQEG